MKVTGKVKNVVDFGAFVEIGIKESALIHVSEMSNRFVKDPMEVLKVGDVREFRIISLDPIRRRIGLSLKDEARTAAAARVVQPEHVGRDLSIRSAASRPDAQEPRLSARNRAQSSGHQEHRGQHPVPGRKTPAPPREDDGMTYNPFAELLKTRGK